MKRLTHSLLRASVAVCVAANVTAAPVLTQGIVPIKEYTDLTAGPPNNETPYGDLYPNASFPDSPAQLLHNVGVDVPQTSPGVDRFGRVLEFVVKFPQAGQVRFFTRSDDGSELFVGTGADIPVVDFFNDIPHLAEADCCDPFAEPGDAENDAAKTAYANTFPTTTDTDVVTVSAGQELGMVYTYVDGTGGDWAQLAMRYEGDPTPAADLRPIPAEYIHGWVDAAGHEASITQQPTDASGEHGKTATFTVAAEAVPATDPIGYQWFRDGVMIPAAAATTYTTPFLDIATDDGAKYQVKLYTVAGVILSDEATLTVTPDVTKPEIVGAIGARNLTEVTVTFSERLDQTSAETPGNYVINDGALNVTAATLSADLTKVTLTTAAQTLGTKYTLLVSNVQDLADTPNTIEPNSSVIFFPVGPIVERDGFVVFEAENYDRNLDGIWVRDTTRGTPSGGASMVPPNGAGGSEGATKLEYDVEFAQAATYVVWYHAGGDNGNDDSGWFHLNGERPAERLTGNEASMSGFSGAVFEWNSDPQDGDSPFTVDIPSAGVHVVGLARREDGSFFDKFILTTDTSYTPAGLGPPETREGAPNAPTVSVIEPTDGATVPAGSDITVTADASGDTAADLNVVRVEFTANGNVIGEATESPWTVTWANAQDGVYAIQATATDEIGVSTVSASIVVEVGTPPPQGLLVVGNIDLNPSDAGVKARIEAMGWQVTAVQAAASVTADASGKDLVVVSSTVGSGDVNTKFRDVPVPVIQWEQALQDDFLMTLDTDGTDRGTAADQTEGNIVDADHPLAGGLSLGTKTLGTALESFSWGVPGTEAVVIATLVDDATHAIVYAYDTGSTLIDGTTPAPAPRVMFLWGDNGYATATDDALTLFDAAVVWASGIEPVVKTSATIAWVSFHSASDTPSDAAAAAGFTMAPDVAYTDLLTADGHQVTRVITSGTPETALLNAFDLVIISRSVPSGDYQDAAEAAAWHGVTSPAIVMGGYLLRNSRLGFTTGTTIPDTAGPISLTVTDPSHPVFAGIELDAANTMVNTYADVVDFSGTVQRGISVNTDPVAGGGTVLATVATTTDPAVAGMIIGEWPAGSTMGNGGADVLGSDRLVFLTGSREASGLTSEGSGIYDLSADGAQLFRNAVHYMAGTVPGEAGPVITNIQITGTTITVTWTGGGEAETTDDLVNGTWTGTGDTDGEAVINVGTGNEFIRINGN